MARYTAGALRENDDLHNRYSASNAWRSFVSAILSFVIAPVQWLAWEDVLGISCIAWRMYSDIWVITGLSDVKAGDGFSHSK